MSTPIAPARSPLIAVILSLAATGLGQIYCGRIVRGLVMFLGSLLFAPRDHAGRPVALQRPLFWSA